MNINKQKGFSILTVILVIVAVIVTIGVWALSGESNTSSSKNNVSDIQIAGLINDGLLFKSAFEQLVINGEDQHKIVFIPNTPSTSSAPNLLDPITGIQAPKVNPYLIKEGKEIYEGIWIKKRLNGKNVGATNVTQAPVYQDYAVIIGGIKDDVCQKINLRLHNTLLLPTGVGANPSMKSNINDATVEAPTSIKLLNLVIMNDPDGWTNGCIGSSTNPIDNNMYFQLIKIN